MDWIQTLTIIISLSVIVIGVNTITTRGINKRIDDLRTEMSDLRHELKSEMSNLRHELRSEISELRKAFTDHLMYMHGGSVKSVNPNDDD